ncbi:LysR substrate-binding domain-containing protein [Agrobacterium tumefaciens]|uniref:LysR substrate-binding domain-containing protein n=1 Tax=Agrobacterium tumefaciens TaxID=358 RepID=UPI003BA37BDA
MNFSGLSLRDLEYIVGVADLANFGRAADQCGVSQPALSVQVRKVERWLGVDIFERSTKRVYVTSQGAKIVTQARKVLKEASALADLGRSKEKPFDGELKLGAIATLGPYLFPRIVTGLRAAYPNSTLLLNEGISRELVQALVMGELDAIMMSMPVSNNILQWQKVFHETFVLIGPLGHPATLGGGPGWQDLTSEERLVLSEGHCLRDQALKGCPVVDTKKRFATSISALKYMVSAGEGCTLLPAMAVSKIDELTVGAIPQADIGRDIALVWRRSDTREQDFKDLATLLNTLVPNDTAAQFRQPAIAD